jgi:hypothetical protein
MKKSIALILAAGTLILAGCCTARHVTQWEYKVTVAPRLSGTNSQSPTNSLSVSDWQAREDETIKRWHDHVQDYLDQLGKDGWILVSEDEGTFYLKRPIK